MKGSHTCPWWFIRVFDNPLRAIVQKPESILRELVKPGDRCLDVGCGFGYFTIPMARLVGPSGAVTAVDVQPQMLAGVRRRAERAGVTSRVSLVHANGSGLGSDNAYDFALVFWMLHEVGDPEAMLKDVWRVVKPGGHFLLAEPKGHVREAAFRREAGTAEAAGFVPVRELCIFFSRALLMAKVGGV